MLPDEPVSSAPRPISALRAGRAFWRVLLLITAHVGFGTVAGAVYGQKLQRLYKEDLHLSVNSVATLGIVIGIPSYLQPFIGAWCDLFPLFGYRRRSYYVVASLIEALGFLSLSTLHRFHYIEVASLVLIVAAGGTLLGVTLNAVMVSVGNRTGTFGTLQSLMLFVPMLLALAYTAQLQASATQYWSYQRCFWVAMVICLLRIPFALLIDERRETGRRGTVEEHASHLERRREEDMRTRAALSRAVRSPGLWAIVGFVFYLILTPGINNAIYYYQKDVLHLNDYAIGLLVKWRVGGTVIGLAIFAVGSRFLPVRALVWGAFGMDCVGYLILLGMHDAVTARIVTCLYAMIGVLYGLCLNTLAARACPPGIEGTVYGAVLAAIALGATLSEKFGASLYDYFGPLNRAHHYTIVHGWNYALWIGFVFTLLSAIFIPFLPAWARSGQRLADMNRAAADPNNGPGQDDA